jgi:hypothetical protein
LLTYQDVQPRATAIKAAVLARTMPPWGAVKGFGNFRNDQSLSQEQIELITKWVDGGIRRGNNPGMLPKQRDSAQWSRGAAPLAARLRRTLRASFPAAHATSSPRRHGNSRRAAHRRSRSPLLSVPDETFRNSSDAGAYRGS